MRSLVLALATCWWLVWCGDKQVEGEITSKREMTDYSVEVTNVSEDTITTVFQINNTDDDKRKRRYIVTYSYSHKWKWVKAERVVSEDFYKNAVWNKCLLDLDTLWAATHDFAVISCRYKKSKA